MESREKGTNVFEVPSGERTPFFNLEEGVFLNMGDLVAGKEPIILPSGKDYLMSDDIRQKSAPMEAKVAIASAASLPAIAVAKADGVAGAVGAVEKAGTKVIAGVRKLGGSVLSFTRKAGRMGIGSWKYNPMLRRNKEAYSKINRKAGSEVCNS
ncbi:MAG: hypothetical protein LBJ75_01205 [Puniceicoccales bacterium]|jgi:hypothetical protein|nr:hypothetical protein [Puniceicoccales bacterium]